MAKKPQAQPFKLGFRNSVTEAPPFRPSYNVGCLRDLPTGSFQKGKRGEMICTGGMTHLMGVSGLGNVNKSTVCHDYVLTALDRYVPLAEAMAHDTEYTQSYVRWQMLAKHPQFPNLKDVDITRWDHFMISSQGDMMGNEWFDVIKERLLSKKEARKELMLTTPFLDTRDATGKTQLKQFLPSILEADSLSQMNMQVAQDILDDSEVGTGKAQTVFMRAAGAKTQMFMQLPDLAAQHGGVIIFTAAMGTKIQMDAYAPNSKKLSGLSSDITFKNVPGNISQLTTDVWYIYGAVPEFNSSQDKTPKYPRDKDDNNEGDQDLQRLSIKNLRGKTGPSNTPMEFLVSQKEGLLHGLTEFHYIKGHGKFGIGGNDQRFFLDLYPDTTLMRTTVRGLIEADPKLARAMTLTSELLQLKLMFPEFRDIMVSAKDLYEGIKAKGLDWDELLTTRGYWVFEEMEAGLAPFMSIVDLLQFNAGIKTPYWK